MRKLLPITAAVVCGLVLLVDFFVADPTIDAVGAILAEGAAILAAFALFLGVLSLLGLHLQRLNPGEKGRFLSVVLLVALVATLGLGVAPGAADALTWVFEHVYHPIQSSLSALLAFFVVSAAYRTFKLRSPGALILMVTSLFMLLAQLPFSATLSPSIPVIRDWILAVPVTAGVRGIILGVALGTIATSLRVLLAVDHPYASE